MSEQMTFVVGFIVIVDHFVCFPVAPSPRAFILSYYHHHHHYQLFIVVIIERENVQSILRFETQINACGWNKNKNKTKQNNREKEVRAPHKTTYISRAAVRIHTHSIHVDRMFALNKKKKEKKKKNESKQASEVKWSEVTNSKINYTRMTW